MRQAVILVGGRGTRLGALAKDIPKPLMPIAGETAFLDLLIEDVARHGVKEITLLAGHLSDVLRSRYEGASIRGGKITIIAESQPAGTAGALRNAGDALDERFLMLNGDSFLDVNYLALSAAQRSGDEAVMALRRVPDAARFGRVETERDRIVAFHEKVATFKGEALISAGIYALRRSVLDFIHKTPCSIETDVFPELARRGVLKGVVSNGHFVDIGLPETLQEAREILPDVLRRGAAFFDRDGTLIHDDGYTFRPEALHWQPGAIDAIRRCNDSGRLVIVATNQAGVARGLYTEADVQRFHAHMQNKLRPHGAHIDAFYYCPYHGDGVVAEYAHADHPDRKPNPGMLRRAMLEWRIDPSRSFVVGDTDSDICAATAADLPSFLVKSGGFSAAVSSGLTATRPRARNTAFEMLKQRAAAGREWLFDHALPLWWNRGFDRNANCFHERLAMDGTPLASLPRRIRVQARQTLVYARAGRLGWNGPWREATEAGADILLSRGLRPDGGTRHLLDASGLPLDDRRDLYDHAFVVLGLTEAAHALGDRNDLLSAASNLAAWTYNNWSSPAGGFTEGGITPTPPRRQNPHMHWFEAMLALFEASGDALHLDRASAIAHLLETKLFDHHHGALPELFDDQWRAQCGEDGLTVEPGHLFEWSWLLHRWYKLGGGDFGIIAERLRVYGELYGVGPHGDINDDVFIDGRPCTDTSKLWPHTERVKASVIRYERTRDPDAATSAIEAHDVMMSYCDVPARGLWRNRRSADGNFIDEPALASSFYHLMMALYELSRVAAP